MRILHAFVAVAAMLTVPAQAQDDERFRLERTEDGYVRLDTVTGRTALCREQGAQLVCRMAVEDRAAYDDRLDELESRLAAAEDRLAALESRFPELRLPGSEDVDQAMDQVERFLRRFLGIARDLEREMGDEETGSAPDRT